MVQRYSCRSCGKTFSLSNNNGLRVSKEKINLAMKLLCESSGIRATHRITGLHQETVLKILKIAGTLAENVMDKKAKDLKCEVVAADEIHSFVHAREFNIKEKSADIGAQFTFLGVDQKSRFIISSVTGERSMENAEKFFSKMKQRVAGRFQLNTDSWRSYYGKQSSIRRVFGDEIDHVTEEKTFWKQGQFVSRSLAHVKRTQRIGDPDMSNASTSRVERTNLNLRTFSRRFTRCTLGHSKKLVNHRLAVDLFVWYQNFGRKNGRLKTTPAVSIGIAASLMSVADLWAHSLMA